MYGPINVYFPIIHIIPILFWSSTTLWYLLYDHSKNMIASGLFIALALRVINDDFCAQLHIQNVVNIYFFLVWR